MNEKVKIIFGLIGGLAIFLYGMNLMSDSLQKAAGEKMKKVLAYMTKNAFLGVLSGALVTAVLQSSSATTVMAIGFVSAGLMTLPQAISIIFGANIGTTMTAQLIAFKISDYIYIIIFIGFILAFLAKKEKLKNIGTTIFAFGLLFLGIETMGSVMKPLASSPVFVNMIEKVAHFPVLGVFVGMCMTLVVQSSSATIAVLQNFASQALPGTTDSIIGLAGAIPVLFGDNIGTTITALLASIGQSRNAKRTAIAHCIFNISGTLLFIWFVKPYAEFIKYISVKGPEVDVISRQIANAHTCFNLIMTVLWLIGIKLMVKIVMTIIPLSAEEKVASAGAKYLDKTRIHQPSLALHLVCKEVIHCSEIAKEMLHSLTGLEKGQLALIHQSVEEKCSYERDLSRQINDYVSQIFSKGTLTEEQASQATGALFVLSDIDRISDNSKEIASFVHENETEKSSMRFSKTSLNDMKNAAADIGDLYDKLIDAIETGNKISEDQLLKDRAALLEQDDKMRDKHMKRVAKGKCSAALTAPYNHVLTCVNRIGNSCVNLADFAAKRVDFTALLQEPEELKKDIEEISSQENAGRDDENKDSKVIKTSKKNK